MESTRVPSVSTLPPARSATRNSLFLVSTNTTRPSASSTTLLSWANPPGSLASRVAPPWLWALEQAAAPSTTRAVSS